MTMLITADDPMHALAQAQSALLDATGSGANGSYSSYGGNNSFSQPTPGMGDPRQQQQQQQSSPQYQNRFPQPPQPPQPQQQQPFITSAADSLIIDNLGVLVNALMKKVNDQQDTINGQRKAMLMMQDDVSRMKGLLDQSGISYR
jgi:hypothetical protein